MNTLTPSERGGALASLGYTVKRTAEPGVYMIRRPDGVTYRVNVPEQHCSCPSTVPCKHLAHCHWWDAYDRAVDDLAAARQRDVLVAECEAAEFAAGWHLRRVAGMMAVEMGKAA